MLTILCPEQWWQTYLAPGLQSPHDIVALTVLFPLLFPAASAIVQLFRIPEKKTLEILRCLKWTVRL